MLPSLSVVFSFPSVRALNGIVTRFIIPRVLFVYPIPFLQRTVKENGFQFSTVTEGMVPNICHVIRYRYGGQVAGAVKGRVADACHARGNLDGGQRAPKESRISNIDHSI